MYEKIYDYGADVSFRCFDNLKLFYFVFYMIYDHIFIH